MSADRGTEGHRADLSRLDLLPTSELVELMNAEDASVPVAVARARPQIAAAIDALVARLLRGGRLIYVGAGTAGRLAVVDAAECGPTFGVGPDVVRAVLAGGERAFGAALEGAEDDTAAAERDLAALEVRDVDGIVAVSASGRTPYVLAAVRYARRRGALTVGLTANAGAPLSSEVDHAIEVVTGPEVITGSTRLKAGTAQKLVLNMISTIAMVKLGKTYGNLMVDARASNAKLRRRAHRTVSLVTGADDAAVEAALRDAGGDVKTAIVMLLEGIDVEAATTRLEASRGVLRRALEPRR